MYAKRALTQRAQYQSVYASGITKLDKYLVIKVLGNQLNYSRFGYSINKRIGKAVYRNRIRRLLKEITRGTRIKQGFDIIFIARDASLYADFHQLKGSVCSLLGRMELLELDDKETCTKID